METLFYYPGFVNTQSHLAGTNRMILTAAEVFKGFGSEVTIASERVERKETVRGVQVLPFTGSLRELISGFDLVVFCCGDIKRYLRKSTGQRWLRYQHCWDFPINEYTDKFDLVLGVSDRHVENMKRCGVPAEKLREVPNSVDTRAFHDQGLKRDDKAIMYCGSIVKSKGLHILLDAMWMAKGKGYQWKLDVYGDARMTASDIEYEKGVKLKAKGLSVKFHGAVGKNELVKAYSRSSILCLPSQIESFGLVLVEAQACGCIPVVFESGGVLAAVDRGRTATVYIDNTSRALFQAIRYTMAVAGDEMRQGAIKFVRERLNREKTISALKEVFEEIIR